MTTLQGAWLVPGTIDGSVLRLDEPLSFWGGIDPVTGAVIDRTHPQFGARLAGRVLALPGTRGSSGTPGVLGETLRIGTGPAAIVVARPDVNLVAGSLAAEALYHVKCPILQVTNAVLAQLSDGENVRAAPAGER